MRDRVRPPKEHDDLLNRLREDGVFSTRQKAMMFAASLGYRNQPNSPVSELTGYGEGIPLSVFRRAGDESFIDALAVTVENNLHVLSADQGNRRLEIFEHFARLGLECLATECYAPGQEPMRAVLDLIDRLSDQASLRDKLPGLESLKKLTGSS